MAQQVEPRQLERVDDRFEIVDQLVEGVGRGVAGVGAGPWPRCSTVMTCRDAARSSITPAQSPAFPVKPCTSTSAEEPPSDSPRRATANSAPSTAIRIALPSRSSGDVTAREAADRCQVCHRSL